VPCCHQTRDMERVIESVHLYLPPSTRSFILPCVSYMSTYTVVGSKADSVMVLCVIEQRAGATGGSPASASDRPILPQVIEQRNGEGHVTDQFIWDPAYVDELVTHDRDTDGDGSVDQRLYATHDRLYSVLSLVDEDGQAIEHYEYSPYGADPLDPRKGFAAITDADTGLPLSADTSAAQYLYTGRRYDAVIGFNDHRRRLLSHNLGRWVQHDPMGMDVRALWECGSSSEMQGAVCIIAVRPLRQYHEGPGLYAYVAGEVLFAVDPEGLGYKRRYDPHGWAGCPGGFSIMHSPPKDVPVKHRFDGEYFARNVLNLTPCSDLSPRRAAGAKRKWVVTRCTVVTVHFGVGTTEPEFGPGHNLLDLNEPDHIGQRSYFGDLSRTHVGVYDCKYREVPWCAWVDKTYKSPPILNCYSFPMGGVAVTWVYMNVQQVLKKWFP